MTRQEIERMARLEECNAELAKENAELKARLEKAVELRFCKGDKAYAIIDTLFYTDVFPVTIEAVDIVYEVFDGELTTIQHSTRLFTDRTQAEQTLSELKNKENKQ